MPYWAAPLVSTVWPRYMGASVQDAPDWGTVACSALEAGEEVFLSLNVSRTPHR